MRTSYIAPPSPRNSLTPHRYFTRNNVNPTSPNSEVNEGFPRDNTPPTFLDKRNNLFQYRGHLESSDDELDDQHKQDEQPKSKLKSAYHLLRNILMWTGLTFLTTNVYILSQLKKLWVWKDPFSDTGYNNKLSDGSPDRLHKVSAVPRSGMPRLTALFSNQSPVESHSSEVGWCGFITALIFLAGLVLLLGILLVPYPLDGKAEPGVVRGELFIYLEEQKQFVTKVSELEAGLLSLDARTVKSHDELKSAIKELEKEKDRLESELVAIATLDRQQSSHIDELQNQHSSQSAKIEGVSGSVNDLKVHYDNVKTQIEMLRQSIGTLADTQTKLADTQTAGSQKLEELVKSQGTLAEGYGGLAEQQKELGVGQKKLAGLYEPLARTQEDLQAKYQVLLSQSAHGVNSADIEKLKAELVPLIAEEKVDASVLSKLEEQSVLFSKYQERLQGVESKISALPAHEPPTIPTDLLSRLDTLSRELETLRSSTPTSVQYTTLVGKLDTVRADLSRYVSESGVRIEEVFAALEQSRHRASEDTRLSQVKLQSIESKLAVMTALQERLGRVEAAQQTATNDKSLQREIAGLVAQLKNLDVKYEAKVEELNSAYKLLGSDKDKDAKQTSNTIKQNTEEIKTIKEKVERDVTLLQQKLSDLDSATDRKIRGIVLEVLASVTHSSHDTRFFADWLKATFLTREQFDREVSRNDTLVLPPHEELVQIVISELHSKHRIDLQPGSGITTADIRFIVKEALQTFDEDKTGRADFALEALGGSIMSIGCTETYYEGAPYASFMSVPLFRIPNPPNVALQPDITPGKCWAFKGTKGYMMIKLAHAVNIDGFSMEHLPRKLSLNNDISSAPNKFTVRGISHPEDNNSHRFGEFKYSDTGAALQYFNIAYPSKVAYEIVELEIESNHGNAEYTCLYRIRVHGQVPKLV